MSIQILIDMNLSPDWVDALSAHGWACVHWSTTGGPKAADREIMAWAHSEGYVVFTHDLEFGTMLALTHATGPSVIQVRGQNVLPDHMSPIVVAALKQHESELSAGALIVVEEAKSRVRILPILVPIRVLVVEQIVASQRARYPVFQCRSLYSPIMLLQRSLALSRQRSELGYNGRMAQVLEPGRRSRKRLTVQTGAWN